MSWTKSLANVAVFAALCAVVLSVSAGKSQENTPSQDPAQIVSVAKWIKQLDSDRFAERNEASRNLEAVGKAACPALAEAALGQSREVTLRAIAILRKHLKGDKAMKEAAKEALKRVAESDHESAARRAKEVLDPKPPAQRAVFPGGQIAPRVNAGRLVRRVRINNGANGVKEIEVEDNRRKIKITEDPTGGIRIEVSEKKDGKETTQKYSAKTVDELKKTHPEAHKIYGKYAKQAGGGIQMRAVQVQPRARPPMPLQPGEMQQRVLRKTAASRLRHARRVVEMAAKHLQQAGETTEELKNSVKRLEEIAQELQNEEAKLDEGG